MKDRHELKPAQVRENVIGFFDHHAGITLVSTDFGRLDVDRVYLHPFPRICAAITYLEASGIINPWKHSIGKHRLDSYSYRTAVRGYRENRFYCSAQLIAHEDDTGALICFEIDWDWFNPDVTEGAYRVGSLLGHCGEFVWYRATRTKTNPFQIARRLRKRGYSLRILA
jgi:hypothetical protein